MKRLLLAGGGHAQLAVLTALARARPAAVDTVLLNSSPWQYYSAMLPGWIAGHYREAECRIDLRPLAAAAGARLLIGQAVGIDTGGRSARLADGRSIDFDLLSLDIGSETQTGELDALGSGRLLPVKPLPRFFAAWAEVAAAAAAAGSCRLCVVGGGAAGVELALAAQQTFRRRGVRGRVALVAAALLPDHAESVRRRVLRYSRRAGLELHLQRATGRADGLVLADGNLLEADCVIAATGARPAAWLAGSGLACSEAGWVEVDACHRSLSHPEVFAAGDVCTRTDRLLARSGVHAVHAGPVLAANLLAVLAGKPLHPYLPKPRSLYLIACGPRHAIASWGRCSAEGGWVWRWKDWIDRGFIRRHAVTPSHR